MSNICAQNLLKLETRVLCLTLNDTKYCIDIVSHFFCSGLNPSTRYVVSVYAENRLGEGQKSANISAITGGQ